MKKLDNKVAVITGGTSGMGLATAKRFVAEGAYVFIMGRRQHELDAAVKDIGTHVTGVQGDIAKLPDLDRLYGIVKAQKGRVDIVFANAGVGEFVATGCVTEAHFDKTFDVNVKGTLFTVQKALPLLNDGGSIILTGSIASVKGIPAFGVYWPARLPSVPLSAPGRWNSRIARSAPMSLVPARSTHRSWRRFRSRPLPKSSPVFRWGAWVARTKLPKRRYFWPPTIASFVTGIELFVDGGTAQV
jgi:hypothetical protein